MNGSSDHFTSAETEDAHRRIDAKRIGFAAAIRTALLLRCRIGRLASGTEPLIGVDPTVVSPEAILKATWESGRAELSLRQLAAEPLAENR